MRRFLITGCGRSGTTFTAKLLNAMSVRTSHEEFFTAYTPPSAVPGFDEWLQSTGTIGEVSGLAVPHLSRLADDIVVIHQVRNPVAVIGSLMGLRSLHPELRALANIKFNFRHISQMHPDDSPVILCMKYWLWWNRAIRAACSEAPIRVEDIAASATGALRRVFLLCDMKHLWNADRCAKAALKLGARVNGGVRDYSVSWRHLPEGALKEQIAEDAVAYGYTMAELEGYWPLGIACPQCGHAAKIQ